MHGKFLSVWCIERQDSYDMTEVHRILKELYIGMAACMIIFLAAGAFFARPYYMFAIALFAGNLGGALRIYHIYDVLDQALDMGEAGAKKKVIVNSLLRMVVTLALLVGSIYLGITAFAGMALGMIEPKICAYLQPKIRHILIRLGLEELEQPVEPEQPSQEDDDESDQSHFSTEE